MVKSNDVEKRSNTPPVNPIGVFQSLVAGFDRVAARPILILPPLVLDCFLWLGPHFRLPGFVLELGEKLVPPPGSEEGIIEQITLLKGLLTELFTRINLFGVVSSLPVGLPSLMAARMPKLTPWGQALGFQLQEFLILIPVVVGLVLLGQVIGAKFHLWIARQLAPEEEVAKPWEAIKRILGVSVVGYLGSMILIFGLLQVASLLAILLPLLGLIVLFMGFTFLFWGFVYLIFTPHGIVRYRLGVLRAMIESFTLVRWNLMSTVGFFALSFGISWLTNQVWIMPEETTWYILLAVVGHAFVSTTLLAGSYAFYQNRRQWLFERKLVQKAEARQS
jgi:hypothetical protein